jgi:hypothetical protein
MLPKNSDLKISDIDELLGKYLSYLNMCCCVPLRVPFVIHYLNYYCFTDPSIPTPSRETKTRTGSTPPAPWRWSTPIIGRLAKWELILHVVLHLFDWGNTQCCSKSYLRIHNAFLVPATFIDKEWVMILCVTVLIAPDVPQVWMDDYKRLFYMHRPDLLNIQIGRHTINCR